MGFLDDMRDKAEGLVEDHGDKVTDGIDKAADFVDEKTGSKHGEQIDSVADKLKDGVDKLDKKS